MVTYKCEKCNKEFTHKGNYMSHINRKSSCIKENNSENEFFCVNCNKNFIHKGSYYNHVKKCKEKKNSSENNYINNILNKTSIETLNNYTNITNNLKVEGNVKLVKFGDEDLSFIKDDVYKKILNSGFKSIPNLVEQIHFNPLLENNQNIYISNMKNSFVLVYDGEKWEVKDRDDVIEEIMYSKTDHLLEKFDDLIEDLPPKAINKFQRFIEKKDDDKVINQIKKDIKLILYNNRQLPINIRKKLEIKNIDDENDNSVDKVQTIMDNLEKCDDNIIDKMIQLLNDNKIS